jgi:hypothetical protein
MAGLIILGSAGTCSARLLIGVTWMDIIDDYYLAKEVEERLNDGEEAVRVDVDELLS